jgi:hypothetical protein
MLITDVIREAVNEHQIYFLLNACVEAVHDCNPLHYLPEALRELPFAGAEDVSARVEQLEALHASLDARDEGVRRVVAEALEILTMAARRLETIRAENPKPLLEAA